MIWIPTTYPSGAPLLPKEDMQVLIALDTTHKINNTGDWLYKVAKLLYDNDGKPFVFDCAWAGSVKPQEVSYWTYITEPKREA